MNKSELIAKMAENANITKVQATDALNALTASISEALKGDDKVSLVGFGTFSAAKKEAREGRNPATGETIKIAAKTSVKFKAGKELVEGLN
ncbi:MAG: HU family DNA-binding protein [Saprospiraceae bacterium]|nr:HU family DNA-binding protein [Saprospiraceae bacterium]MBP7679906.1 HU family DNA-binding protein [Saprospiraceae bacterium]